MANERFPSVWPWLWRSPAGARRRRLRITIVWSAMPTRRLTITNAAGREFRCSWTRPNSRLRSTGQMPASVATPTSHRHIPTTTGPRSRSIARAATEQQGESYGASVHGLARISAATRTLPPAWIATVRMTFCRRRRRSRRSTLCAQAQTCGRCHVRGSARRGGQRSWQGHGRPANATRPPAPTAIRNIKFEALKDGSPLEISEAFAAAATLRIIEQKYNLPADRVKTFLESYHGLAAQYGSTVAANCASCHGYH